ncbi:MAG: M15 family metallopeptidase [Candidatus Woesebacteria bacterium]|jgi:D-alanyl-D-alanine dipeptidase
MTELRAFTSLQQITKLSPRERARYYIPAEVREQIPIIDNGEPLITQPNIENLGIVCRPFWQDPSTNQSVDEGEAFRQYIASNPSFKLYIRQKTAQQLALAQSHLPNGWKIVLKAAYRPPQVQQILFDEMLKLAKNNNPKWSNQQLIEHTRKYVADPTLSAPAHTTGGAIDIVVIDRNGNYVDMGSPINVDGPKSMTFCKNIPKQAQKNRITLLEAMLKAEFANLVDEWWHFSYGDPTWAAFYCKKVTPYSKITQTSR